MNPFDELKKGKMPIAGPSRMNIGKPMPNQQQPLRVNEAEAQELLRKGTSMTCLDCGHDVFIPAMKHMYFSALISPTRQDSFAVLDLRTICFKCGKQFNEKEWMDKRNKKFMGEEEPDER